MSSATTSKASTADARCVLTWQARRTATWHAARTGLAVALSSFAVLGACVAVAARVDHALPYLVGGLCAFMATFVAMCFVAIAVHRHYRCPRCDRVPMSGGFQAGWSGFAYRRGVALNPRACPACGAPFA